MPTAMEGTTPIFVTEIELPKTWRKKLGDALVANKNVQRPTACIFHGHIRGQNVCFGRGGGFKELRPTFILRYS